MKYCKFIIANYKGITDAVEIDIEKNTLIPIIGINECGKTTLLNAIYSFDHINDWQNETYSHLDDIFNLYQSRSQPCTISAIIKAKKSDLKDILKQDLQIPEERCNELLGVFSNEGESQIMITRKFLTNNSINESVYEFSPKLYFDSKEIENSFCEYLLSSLPYILYFDDFRETFPDEIEINEDNKNTGWLPIIQELFIKTNEKFSIYELKNLDERRRKSIISQVKKSLMKHLHHNGHILD